MGLVIFHPEVAYRDCEMCKRFVFKENGEIDTFQGAPIERPRGTLPPCHYGADQCPKVSPDSGMSLNEKNALAYQHYRECRAIGSFPDDFIVRENAAVIREIEDQAGEIKQQKFLLNIMTAMRGA